MFAKWKLISCIFWKPLNRNFWRFWTLLITLIHKPITQRIIEKKFWIFNFEPKNFGSENFESRQLCQDCVICAFLNHKFALRRQIRLKCSYWHLEATITRGGAKLLSAHTAGNIVKHTDIDKWNTLNCAWSANLPPFVFYLCLWGSMCAKTPANL